VNRLDALLGQAMRSVPECPGHKNVEDFLRLAAERLCPAELRKHNANPGLPTIIEHG
jgi:hypothetical protein